MKHNLNKILDISPSKLWGHISRPSMIPVKIGKPPSSTVTEAMLFLFEDLESEEVEFVRRSFLNYHRFFNEIDDKMIAYRGRKAKWEVWSEFLYLVTRISKPKLVIETGVFDGQSSAIILQALHNNDQGTLVSIDVPAIDTIKGSTSSMIETRLPKGCQPGWAIPDYLKRRHHLNLGDSKELLPRVLKEHSQIDIFVHDSLHTFEHQYFEYKTVWPYILTNGFLMSDDIYWSPAFHKFCKEENRTYVRIRDFGAVRK